MKILIAYDGTPPADAAIDDLTMAGLPETGEALVFSVADVWLPPENLQDDEERNAYVEGIVEGHRQKAREAVAAAARFAQKAADRVRHHFPKWTVTSDGSYGSPAWEVIERSESFDTDLIVAGSHGKSAITRFFLGSVSQKVLTEARCSVRVARGRVEVDEKPSQIVIGFDASQGAQAAVESVASRNWRQGSKACLVGVVNPVSATMVGQFVPPVMGWVEEENTALENLLEGLAGQAADKLKAAGLEVDIRILSGDPKNVIVEEAEALGADSIFMGANRYGSKLERFLLGSVSAAVAARAHCSVEVVRTKAAG
jgi:nucleotide-binding universal stress UspA family protein